MTDRAQDAPADIETRASEQPRDHKAELRLWLRLLTCTTLTEGMIRTRLRETFGVTLPRFDLMAQLEKEPDGLPLGEVSRRMMVSNGNVTGLVERLAADGLVARTPDANDRRAARVSLTPAGRRAFARMADAHEGWVADAFAGLTEADVAATMRLLAKLKRSVRDMP